MYLLKGKTVLRAYDVAFGGNPTGHKEREGDERTPDGEYLLGYTKADSAYYRAIHGFGWLSWLTQRFNWTDGCIAVTNKEMDEIWSMVTAGTPIEIQP